jgi:hypothetical protein
LGIPKEVFKAIEGYKSSAALKCGGAFLNLARFTFVAMAFHRILQKDFTIVNAVPHCMRKIVCAHTDFVFVTVRASKRRKEGLEMIKRAANLAHTEAQSECRNLLTGKGNSKAEADLDFQLSKT